MLKELPGAQRGHQLALAPGCRRYGGCCSTPAPLRAPDAMEDAAPPLLQPQGTPPLLKPEGTTMELLLNVVPLRRCSSLKYSTPAPLFISECWAPSLNVECSCCIKLLLHGVFQNLKASFLICVLYYGLSVLSICCNHLFFGVSKF